MIINEIPLQKLKDILATDTPLAIETTEALIERLEILGRRLDAMRRQRDGYRNELRRSEAKVAKVREVLESRRTMSALASEGLRALDGESHE